MKFDNRDVFVDDLDTVYHEFFHIVGLTSALEYSSWNKKLNTTRRSSEVILRKSTGVFRNLFISENSLNWARKHYGCPTLEGVPLENRGTAGTAGSHWDKFIVGNDVMGPSSYYNHVISGLNFALLNDTGYYAEINEDQVEHLVYGENAGCKILSGKCEDNPMTRTGNLICSPDHYSLGYSINNQFMEGCSFFREFRNGDCRHKSNSREEIPEFEYGYGSRCIFGRVSDRQNINNGGPEGGCFKTDCDPSTNTITIHISGNNYTCTKDQAGKKKFLKGSLTKYIICPDTAKMCVTGLNCPNDCNGNGRCLDSGLCRCYNSFKGEDCSIPIPVEERYAPLTFGYKEPGSCDPSCKACEKDKPKDCTACEESKELRDKRCVDKCKPGSSWYQTMCCEAGSKEDDGICCSSSKRNHNGLCCYDYEENMGGICCRTSSEHNSNGICCKKDEENMSGICCKKDQHFSRGICCEKGKSNSNGVCCPSTERGTDGICCPEDRVNSNGVCCLEDKVGTNGICCDEGFVGSHGLCCPPDKMNKNGVCCLFSEDESNGICCPAGRVSKNGICCLQSEIESNGICCEQNKVNKNGICCLDSEIESKGMCCPPGKVNSNNVCCLDTEVGSNGICCPKGSEESLGMCCPSGKVNKNGVCCLKDEIGSDGICCQDGFHNSKGHCCPEGKDYKNSMCCESNEVESNGMCCPQGWSESSGVCCPDKKMNKNGICCSEDEIESNKICCPEGSYNSRGTCCKIGTEESHGECCPTNHEFMDGICCKSTHHNSRGVCCEKGLEESNGGCCPVGKHLINNTCCEKNEIESNGICCPQGSYNSRGTCCEVGLEESEGKCCPYGKHWSGTVCCLPHEDGSEGICCPQGKYNSEGLCCGEGEHNSLNICCKNGLINKNGVCCQESEEESQGICCPAGLINRDGRCCSPSCQSCQEGLPGVCTSCSAELKLKGNLCCQENQFEGLDAENKPACLTCNKPEYFDEKTKKCTTCGKFCKICRDQEGTENKEEECTEVCMDTLPKDQFEVEEGDESSICRCLEGKFLDDIHHVCHPCHPSCGACSEAGEAGCISCSDENAFFVPEETTKKTTAESRQVSAPNTSPTTTTTSSTTTQTTVSKDNKTGRCIDCVEDYDENKEFCETKVSQMEAPQSSDVEEEEEHTQKSQSKRDGVAKAPERKMFSSMIKIKFKKEIVQVIQKIIEDKQQFDILKVFSIEIDPLTRPDDYTIAGDLSKQQDGYVVYFYFTDDFGFVNVKFKVINGHYFLEKYRELKKSQNRRRALNEEQETTPKTQTATEDLSALILPKGGFTQGISANRVPKKSKIDQMTKVAGFLESGLIIVGYLALIVAVFSAFDLKLNVVGRFLRFSCFYQLLIKIPLLNINYGSFGLAFMDKVYATDYLYMARFIPEDQVRSRLSGKLAEYSVPVLLLNSNLLPSLLILVPLILGIIAQFAPSKYRTKHVLLRVLFTLMAFKLLDGFFYSSISLFWHDFRAKAPQNPTAISYVFSVAVFLGCVGVVLAVAWFSYKHGTDDGRPRGFAWVKHKKELVGSYQLVSRGEMREEAMDGSVMTRFINIASIIRLMVYVIIIGHGQGSGNIQMLTLLVLQILVVILFYNIAVKKNVYSSRLIMFTTFTSECLTVALLSSIIMLNFSVGLAGSDRLWSLTVTMIVFYCFVALAELVGFASSTYLELTSSQAVGTRKRTYEVAGSEEHIFTPMKKLSKEFEDLVKENIEKEARLKKETEKPILNQNGWTAESGKINQARLGGIEFGRGQNKLHHNIRQKFENQSRSNQV